MSIFDYIGRLRGSVIEKKDEDIQNLQTALSVSETKRKDPPTRSLTDSESGSWHTGVVTGLRVCPGPTDSESGTQES